LPGTIALIKDWFTRVISGCGAAMSTGLYCIELGKLTRIGGDFSDWSAPATAWYLKPRLALVPVVLFAGAVAWLVWGNSSGRAESGPVPAANTTTPLATAPAELATPPTNASLNPTPSNQVAPAEPLAVNGLKISSQSWRRGGLGSNALFTFTLRNNNDYAVKDVQILCAFTRKDGSHLTDRTRVIPDTIEMKSRKTFTRMHVGYVNVNASKAICSLVTASRS
jgi:hypothetical protein